MRLSPKRDIIKLYLNFILWTVGVLSKHHLSQLCKSFFIEDFIVVHDLFIVIFGFKFILVLVFSFVLALVFNFSSILVFFIVSLVVGYPLGGVLFICL